MQIKFKKAAQVLKKELKENYGFELAHSNILNLLSKTIGFKNYNTLKGKFGDNITININNESITNDITDEEYFFSINDVELSTKQSDFLLGRDMVTGDDIYSNALNQHMITFGTRGSGLYIIILNMLKQSLLKSNGSIFIDGIGDYNLLEDFHKMVNQHNRNDDFIVLKLDKKQEEEFNIFDKIELYTLKDAFSHFILNNKRKDFFHLQAADVLNLAFGIMEYRKSIKKEVITPSIFKDVLSINSYLINLIPADKNDSNLPDMEMVKMNDLEGYEESWVSREYIYEDENLFESITSYIKTYSHDSMIVKSYGSPRVLPEQLKVQHGYSIGIIESITKFIKKSKNLSLNANVLDFDDIIINQKLLYCLIPASFSNTDKSLLGSILFKSISQTYIKILEGEISSELKGDYMLVLNNILDFAKSNENMLESIIAQSRSIGVGCHIASQNLHTISEEPLFVDRIMANTATKLFLKNNDLDILDKVKLLLSALPDKYIEEQLQIEDVNEITKFLSQTSNGKGLLFSNEGLFKIQSPYFE